MTDDRAAEPLLAVETAQAEASDVADPVEVVAADVGPEAAPVHNVAPDADEMQALADQRAERERKRLRQTVRDMVLSMLVVAAVVLVIFQPWGRSTPDPVRVVDPAPVVAAARESLAWPVLAPVGLPSTWRPTSARLEIAADGESVVQTGYLSPSVMYVGLTQSQTKETAFVRDRTGRGTETGSAAIGGSTWTRFETEDGKQRSLVRVDDGVTYIVTGQAAWPEIDAFAASLRAG